MAEVTSISAYPTLKLTREEWVGELSQDAVSLVPREEDDVTIEYAHDDVSTTYADVWEHKIFHYPETLHDSNLSLAVINSERRLDVQRLQTEKHEGFQSMPNVPIFSMQKGQRIFIVRMLQDVIDRVNLGIPIQANRYSDVDRGKAYVIHIKDICHKSSMRTFLFRNPPPNIIVPLKELADAQYLTVEINTHGAYIQVDTAVYLLLAVHTAIASLLLSRKPGLLRGVSSGGELALFINVAAEAHVECGLSVKRTLLAFASEWNVKDQLLSHVRSLELASDIYHSPEVKSAGNI